MVAEHLLGARLIQVSEENLCLHHQGVAHQSSTPDCCAFWTKVQQIHLIDQLAAGQHLAVIASIGDFGQNHFFSKIVDIPDENAPGLGQALQDQSSGHHRIARKMIGKVVLGQAEVFQRLGRFSLLKF